MSRNIKADAQAYVAMGLEPIPLEEKSKKPKCKSWKEYDAISDHYRQFTDNVNIGVKLGELSNRLCDIDLDWQEARLLIASTTLSSMARFGRESAKGSHIVFIAKKGADLKTIQLKLPAACNGMSQLPKEHSLVIVEVRATGSYTMFPNSIHPSGEKVEWETPDGITPVILDYDYNDILAQIKLIAFLSVVLRFYPGKGSRDEMHLRLAGVLARAGKSAEEIDRINILLAELAGDEEAKDRAKGRDAVARLEKNEPVMGLPKLVEILGLPSECINTFSGWLGLEGSGYDKTILNPKAPLPTAKKFVQQCYPNGIFCNGSFLTCENGAYREVEEAKIEADIYNFLDKAFVKTADGMIVPYNPTKSKVQNVLDALKANIHIEAGRYNPPCWLEGADIDLPPHELLACRNGIVHLTTGILLSPTPRFFTRNALEFDYLKNAGVPKKWLQFLYQIWPDDEQSVLCLQEIFGYLLTPDNSLHKIFLIVGPPRSGKGTIARVLVKLVGENNTAAPSLNSLNSDFGLQPLIGKQLATVSDMRIGNKVDAMAITENLLRLSGGDRVSINRKYKTEWEGTLAIRFFIMTNELPQFSDNSGALAKRFVPLVMSHSFYGEENPNLTNELLEELPAILNWAIEGWKRLKQRGKFEVPKSAEGEIRDLNELASPIAAFVNECCELGKSYTARKEDLFAEWIRWCERQGDMRPGTSATFGRNLLSLGNIKADRETGGDRKNIYIGIKIKGATTGESIPF